MFVSTDTDGKVLVNTVDSIALGIKKSSKITVIDPKKELDC
jgi:hypothetical protein